MKKEVPEWRSKNKILVYLRGDYNSVRYRFYVLPKEYIAFQFAKLRGLSYTEFYAKRMDGEALKSSNRPIPVTNYIADGKRLVNYAIKHGLKPTDRVLDYGCGVARVGLYFLKYLQPGLYTGVDISAGRLEKGRRLLVENGFPEASFTLKPVATCEVKELHGEMFDVMWSYAVFGHMPTSEWRIALAHLRDLLSDDGYFFFTFSAADTFERRNFKDFWVPESEARKICDEAGWTMEIMGDWETTDTSQRMCILRKK